MFGGTPQNNFNGGGSRGRGRGNSGGRGRGRGRGKGKGGAVGIRFANHVAKFDREVEAHMEPGRPGIQTIAASSGNNTIFTGGNDGKVKMFDLMTAAATEQQEGSEVTSLCFHANWLFVGFLQPVLNNQLVGFVKGYNFGANPVENYNLAIDQSFPAAHRAKVTSICVANDILFTGGEDGAVRGWKLDGSAWNLVGALGGNLAHNGPVSKIAFVNNHLFTGASNGEIKMWDMAGQCLSTFQAHEGIITDICGWAANGLNALLTCSVDTKIKVWDLGSGGIPPNAQPIFTYPPPELLNNMRKPKAITCMATHVLTNGTHVIIIGTSDGSLQAFDLPDFKNLGFLSGHARQSSITSIEIVLPQNLLFAGTANGRLNCFKLL